MGTKSTVGLVAKISGKANLDDKFGNESHPYLVVASSFEAGVESRKISLPAISIRSLQESDANLVFSYKTEYFSVCIFRSAVI